MSKNICFRLANQQDIDDVATIYQRLHETLSQTINYPRWPIGIYPIKEDAIDAVNKNELYVLVDEHIIGSVILNQTQEDGYQNAHWLVKADDSKILVIHTLAIDPMYQGQGYAGKMLKAIICFAKEKGYHAIRLDITQDNIPARYLYQKHGFYFTGIVDLKRQSAGIDYCEMYEYNLKNSSCD